VDLFVDLLFFLSLFPVLPLMWFMKYVDQSWTQHSSWGPTKWCKAERFVNVFCKLYSTYTSQYDVCHL